MIRLILSFAWPQRGDNVRLKQAFPDIGLRQGSVGRVCGRWAFPTSAYEVEFGSDDQHPAMRTLIMARHVERC